MASAALRSAGQHLIGHAFEGLAEHHELAGARYRCTKVQIAEPAGASAVTPFCSEDHRIERRRRLDLEPGAAARTRLVRRVESLCHHPFVAGRECGIQEGLALAWI